MKWPKIGSSLKIGSAWGIPIELHVTFILLIAVFFFLSILPFFPVIKVFLTYSPYPVFYSFFLVLFLFVFVVFHELAHSIVARRYGITVRKIILYPIGGVSEIEEIPDNPSQEWRMAVAGPLTSLVLGAALLVVSITVSPQISIVKLITLTATGNFLFDLAALNILLGFFNLIPAFPMDGGRVFRALLAERMKYSDATRYAVNIGKIFGIAMVIIGFLIPSEFLLILVGIFVYIGASEEAEQTIVSTALSSVRVRDVMQSEVGAVSPDQTIAEALEVMFKSRYHDALVERDGVFQGVLIWNEIIKIPTEQRSNLRVGDMPLKNISTFPDEAVLEAYKLTSREKIDLIPVVDKDVPSKVVGVLTSEAIANAIEKSRNR
jgi:Zn-dependent protease/CBS domain-containing protein